MDGGSPVLAGRPACAGRVRPACADGRKPVHLLRHLPAAWPVRAPEVVDDPGCRAGLRRAVDGGGLCAPSLAEPGLDESGFRGYRGASPFSATTMGLREYGETAKRFGHQRHRVWRRPEHRGIQPDRSQYPGLFPQDFFSGGPLSLARGHPRALPGLSRRARGGSAPARAAPGVERAGAALLLPQSD